VLDAATVSGGVLDSQTQLASMFEQEMEYEVDPQVSDQLHVPFGPPLPLPVHVGPASDCGADPASVLAAGPPGNPHCVHWVGRFELLQTVSPAIADPTLLLFS
jgi:hypothetical protein